MKKFVNRTVYKSLHSFIPKEQETALEGYLKTYRIQGVRGYDHITFLETIRPKVLHLLDEKQKPFKFRTIFTCKYRLEDQTTGELLKEGYCNATSFLYQVTESDNLSTIFDEM